MRAVLYSPEDETFKEVTIADWKDYSKLLECRYFDVVQLSKDIDIYIDDEGLMVENPHITRVKGYFQPLAGKLIFTGGIDGRGNTTELKLSIDEIKKLIQFTAHKGE